MLAQHHAAASDFTTSLIYLYSPGEYDFTICYRRHKKHKPIKTAIAAFYSKVVRPSDSS